MWPRSWNSRSLRSTTVWPRWMSGAVGSIPSFTRSGRPSPSCASSAPSGRASTAFLSRKSAGSVTGGNARLARSTDGPLGLPPPPSVTLDCRPSGAGAHAGDDHTHTPAADRAAAAAGGAAARRSRSTTASGPPERPKLKKLRLALVLGGLGFIALHLDGLRDDDGGRQPTSRASRTRRASRRRENSVLLATPTRTTRARAADRQREPDPARGARDLARTSRTR